MEHFDPRFSEFSYGFRPGRSAHQAIEQTQRYIAEGRSWIVEMDLAKFFDTVNHDRLISVLERNCRDKMLIRLIRRYLRTSILADGLVTPRDEGTPQGSPLSPILSLIVLDELDKYLEKRGLKFCRYADDCNYTLGPSAPGSACWKTRSSSSRSRSSCGLIATRAASFALEEQKCKKPEPLRSTVGTRPHPTQERSERKGGAVRMRASYRVPLFSK